MSPEKALDLRAKVADYRRTGVGMLDDVMDAFIDLLDGEETLPEETMTLRDRFAIAALPGLMSRSNPRHDDLNDLANWSYDIADKMLVARKLDDEE